MQHIWKDRRDLASLLNKNITSGLDTKWRFLASFFSFYLSVIKCLAANPSSSPSNMKKKVKRTWKLLVKCLGCTVTVDKEQRKWRWSSVRDVQTEGGNRGYWCLQNTGQRIEGSNDLTPLWAPGAHSRWVTSSFNRNDPLLSVSLSLLSHGKLSPQDREEARAICPLSL